MPPLAGLARPAASSPPPHPLSRPLSHALAHTQDTNDLPHRSRRPRRSRCFQRRVLPRVARDVGTACKKAPSKLPAQQLASVSRPRAPQSALGGAGCAHAREDPKRSPSARPPRPSPLPSAPPPLPCIYLSTSAAAKRPASSPCIYLPNPTLPKRPTSAPQPSAKRPPLLPIYLSIYPTLLKRPTSATSPRPPSGPERNPNLTLSDDFHRQG